MDIHSSVWSRALDNNYTIKISTAPALISVFYFTHLDLKNTPGVIIIVQAKLSQSIVLNLAVKSCSHYKLSRFFGIKLFLIKCSKLEGGRETVLLKHISSRKLAESVND